MFIKQSTIMYNLGDRVQHLNTGNTGIVIGYSKRIVDRQCLPTIKVRIISPCSQQKTTVKDLNSRWFFCPEDYRTINPNPLAKHLIIKPVKRYDLAKSA